MKMTPALLQGAVPEAMQTAKNHKEGVPLHPIVSAIGLPTYTFGEISYGVTPAAHGMVCAGFLVLHREIQSIVLEEVLVSFTMVLLFTIVFIKGVFAYMVSCSWETTVLFQHLLTTVYFQSTGPSMSRWTLLVWGAL